MPLGDGGEDGQVAVWELGRNGGGNLLRCVLLHPRLAPGDGPGEALNDVGILFQVTGGGEVGGVGDLTALLADGAEDVTLPGQLHFGGGGLEEGGVVPGAAGKRPGHHVELHGGVHGDVYPRLQAVLPEDVLQGHLRHAAFAAAENRAAPEILPGEVSRLPAHQEGAIPLGELGEDDGSVLLLLVMNVDAGLRPGKAHVRLARQHGGHHLVGPAAVGKLNVQALLLKEALAQGHVLGGVEDGMGDLTEAQGHGCFLRRGAAAAGGGCQNPQGGENCGSFSHSITPKRFPKNFSNRSTPWYMTTAAADRIRMLAITRSMLKTWEP